MRRGREERVREKKKKYLEESLHAMKLILPTYSLFENIMTVTPKTIFLILVSHFNIKELNFFS